MTPNSLLIILITAVWVSVSTLSAATTNAAASIGPSVAGQVPVYTDTSGQLMTPSSSVTNLTLVTPVINSSGGYYSGAILTPWVSTNSSVSLEWKKAPQVWEFSGNAGEWTTFNANSGSSAITGSAPDTSEQGVAQSTTGSLTNGVAGWRLNNSSMTFTTNKQAFMFRFQSPSSLSSDADGYELYIGLGNGAGDAEPTTGAYFYYLHSISNGVWTAKTANNGSRTFASGSDTTVNVVAATSYNMMVEGTSSLVNFWVSSNDGSTWTWIGYSTSNIPSATNRTYGPEYYIRKVGGSVGTGARILYIFRCEMWPSRAN